MITLLSQAIDQTFPQLDQPLKDEISQKVMTHMLEYMKEEVYREDSDGLQNLANELQVIADVQDRSKMYGEKIMQKVASLPKEKQDTVFSDLNMELTRVMHEVYKAVTN